MSTYTVKVPADSKVDSRIVPFFENFYAVSDNPNKHDEYVDALTKDGVMWMGTKKGEGSENIMTIRKGLWSGPVKTRKHHVHRLYVFSELDVMLHGTVDYELHNGKSVTVDWAGHAQFVESDDKQIRMKYYRVYLDSAPVAQAAAN